MKTCAEAIKLTKPYKPGLTHAMTLEAEKVVDSLISERINLNKNQYSALVSFVLTTRKGALARSNLLMLVNTRPDIHAANEIIKPVWCMKGGKKSKILTTLRKEQRKLFLSPCIAVNNRGQYAGA